MARKILLADDSVTAQNMGRKILADAGYEVITVNNGSAALKKISEAKPDLIVLDVYMPGYSGLEVCQRLKEAQESARIPVLLTVGKLEPFKPEEAKRSRADGFIVKPFEASELLSALSKLEDKIVPRSETSKPGRFSRSTAALDEGRYDKTMAVEEDLGWKNRIAFPSKKEKVAQEEGEEAASYNAANKDLRTVVEQKLAEPAAPAVETKVDLGALAPEGLPKDVTPEEIAALAAAAAQVKGKIAESNSAAEVPTEKTAPVEQTAPVVERPQEVAAAQPPVATFAEQKPEAKSEAKIETPSEKPSEAAAEAASIAVPSPADVMAAISGLEQGPSNGTGSGNESHSSHEKISDEPVTMAMAAAVGSVASPSRWKAVSVALAAEEAAISLEQEMQKAYAAFAAAETGHAASAETQSVAHTMATPVELSSRVEPVVSVPASPAPEAAQTLSEVAHAATEAIGAAVKELEAVAASYVGHETVGHASPSPVEQVASEAPRVSAAKIEESPSAKAAEEETAKPSAQEKTEPVETPTAAAAQSTPAEQASSSVSSSAAEQAAATPVEPTSSEPDPSQSTAAAWASWNQNRESAPASAEPASKSAESAPDDAAARAVAAGAEKAPDEASASEPDPEGIASIVDSVLAEMRPKIYEEISRKMGKKK